VLKDELPVRGHRGIDAPDPGCVKTSTLL